MTKADLTRQRLVRAALELFTTEGYHGTTTPRIAKKARVAEGTIYRHFRSKQHLLNELYRAAARWATKLVAETGAKNVGAREKLNELGDRGQPRVSLRSPGCFSFSGTGRCSTRKATPQRAISGSPSKGWWPKERLTGQ